MQYIEWRGTWPSPVVRGRGRRRRDVKDDKTIIPFCARTRHEGQVPRPRDPPYCASVPPTPTRGIIRNNPKSMSLQLADIRRPACECRSVPMTGSHENCRKRKKEGNLCVDTRDFYREECRKRGLHSSGSKGAMSARLEASLLDGAAWRSLPLV